MHDNAPLIEPESWMNLVESLRIAFSDATLQDREDAASFAIEKWLLIPNATSILERGKRESYLFAIASNELRHTLGLSSKRVPLDQLIGEPEVFDFFEGEEMEFNYITRLMARAGAEFLGLMYLTYLLGFSFEELVEDRKFVAPTTEARLRKIKARGIQRVREMIEEDERRALDLTTLYPPPHTHRKTKQRGKREKPKPKINSSEK